MKVFISKENSWDEKVNIVDINNRLVGYSLAQDCCEHADWFFSSRDDVPSEDANASEFKILNNSNLDDLNEILEPYVFDKDFFNQPDWELDAGEAACFRAVADGKPDLFLYIYNYHNGYYGHGFQFKEGNEILKEGTL